MLRGGANKESVEKQEETLTLNVSRMFPRLRAQATYLEDAEFASQKHKSFASFLFVHPYNIVSNLNSKCFCSNVSSFAPTLRLQKSFGDRSKVDAFTIYGHFR